MRFDFGFYSSLLLITFSQGLLYSFLLLMKARKTEHVAHYWLSFFIFLGTLYIAPWMLGFAGWYDDQPYRDFLFYMPFQHLLLMGPAIYFYTQSLLNPAFRFTNRNWLHWLPGILYIVYSTFVWVYDKFIFKGYFFYADEADKDFDAWYQYLGFFSMAFYYLKSLRFYNFYQKMVFQVTSFAENILFRWVHTYLIAFLALILMPVVFDIAALVFPKLQTYTASWWFFLLYSIVLYYIAICGYTSPSVGKIPFQVTLISYKPVLLIGSSDGLKNNNTIDVDFEEIPEKTSEEILRWKPKIEALFSTEKIYLNPELTLANVAQKLNTNISLISKVINQGFGQSFNDFVNHYRVQAVLEKLNSGLYKRETLLGIALDCGFNSKATFNRAFKKIIGLTAIDYIKKLQFS